MTYRFICGFLICLIGFLSNSIAQTDWDKSGEIIDRQVVIVKDRQNILNIGERLFEKADIPDPIDSVRTYQYELTEFPLKLSPELPTVSVNKINPLPLSKLYGNYIKAGYGLNNSGLIDGYFNTVRNKDIAFGGNLHHLSAQDQDIQNARFSNNNAAVHGTLFLNNAAVTAGAQYHRNRYNYYGYDHEKFLDIKEDSIKQIFNIVSAHAGVKSSSTNSPFRFQTNLAFHSLNDHFENTESEFDVDLELGYKLGGSSLVKLPIKYYGGSRNIQSGMRSLLKFNPNYKLWGDRYSITLGVNMMLDKEPSQLTGKDTTGNWLLAPDIQAKSYVVENLFAIFGKAGGDIKRNTLRSHINENPWMYTDKVIFNSTNNLALTAGVGGHLEFGLTYEISGTQAYFHKDYFYVSMPDSSKFTLLFDDTISVNSIDVQLAQQLSKSFGLNMNVSFKDYNMNRIFMPYYKPGLLLDLGTQYHFGDKLSIELIMTYLDKLYRPSTNSDGYEQMAPIFDLNFETSYHFSPRFSVFAQLNNVLSTKYAYFHNYSSTGLTVIGGGAYSF